MPLPPLLLDCGADKSIRRKQKPDHPSNLWVVGSAAASSSSSSFPRFLFYSVRRLFFFHFFRPLVYRLSLSNALLLLSSSGGGVYNTRTALTAFAAFPFAASSSSTRSAVAYTYSPDLKFPHFKRFESSHRRSPGETRANR